MPDLDSEALDFRAASESFAEFTQLARRDLEILGRLTRSSPMGQSTDSSRHAAAGQSVLSNITASQNRIMSARNCRAWSPSLPIRAPRRP